VFRCPEDAFPHVPAAQRYEPMVRAIGYVGYLINVYLVSLVHFFPASSIHRSAVPFVPLL
jgi:hypothetical protein